MVTVEQLRAQRVQRQPIQRIQGQIIQPTEIQPTQIVQLTKPEIDYQKAWEEAKSHFSRGKMGAYLYWMKRESRENPQTGAVYSYLKELDKQVRSGNISPGRTAGSLLALEQFKQSFAPSIPTLGIKTETQKIGEVRQQREQRISDLIEQNRAMGVLTSRDSAVRVIRAREASEIRGIQREARVMAGPTGEVVMAPERTIFEKSIDLPAKGFEEVIGISPREAAIRLAEEPIVARGLDIAEGGLGIFQAGARAKLGAELYTTGAILREPELEREGLKAVEEAIKITEEKGEEIQKFLDIAGTTGAFFAGPALGAGIKAATTVAGEVITKTPEQLAEEDRLLKEAALAALQGALIGIPTKGIIPKEGGAIKKVAGTLFSLEKPVFALGEQTDFEMFQRINRIFAEREDRIRKLQLEKMKEKGFLGDIVSGIKIAEAVVTKAAVGIALPESEIEATLDLLLEGLIGTDIAKPALKKAQKLLGFGVGTAFGGQQIVTAERPSDILMGLSTGVLGLGGLKGLKADVKTKTPQELAFAKLKKEQIELEKIRKKRFELLKGEVGLKAKEGILTKEQLPQTIEIGNINIVKGKKFSGKEIKILAKQFTDLGITKTETEAIDLIKDAKIGAVKVKTRLPTELTLIKGARADIAKTVELPPLRQLPDIGKAEAELGVIGVSIKTPFGVKEVNYVAQIGKRGKMSVRGELQILTTTKKGSLGIIKTFKKAPRKFKQRIPGQPPLEVDFFGRVITEAPTIIEFKKMAQITPVEGLTLREAEVIFKKIEPFSKKRGVSQAEIFKELKKTYTTKELKRLSKKGVPIGKQKIQELIIKGKPEAKDILIEALIGKDVGALKAFVGKEAPFVQISRAQTKGLSPILVKGQREIEKALRESRKRISKAMEFSKKVKEVKIDTSKKRLAKSQEEIRRQNQQIFAEPDKKLKLKIEKKLPSVITIPKEIKLKVVEKTKLSLLKKKSLSEAFQKMELETSKIGQEMKTKMESKLKPRIVSEPIIKQQLKPMLDVKLDVESMQDIKAKQDLRIKQEMKLQQKFQQKLRQKLQLKLQPELDIKAEVTTKIRPKIVSKEKLKPKIKKKPSRLVPKKQFYMPEAKRNEKWVKLAGTGLTERAARGRGARAVDHTVAGRFRIKKVKKGNPKIVDNYFAFNEKKYRDYKIVKGKKVPIKNTWIEKRGPARIDTRGEKEGLTLAKLIKQKDWLGKKAKKKKVKAEKIRGAKLKIPAGGII